MALRFGFCLKNSYNQCALLNSRNTEALPGNKKEIHAQGKAIKENKMEAYRQTDRNRSCDG